MTTPVHYRSTDPGAPVLTGEAGSLVTVVRAVTVDGYGSGEDTKAPLGWEIVFAETQKLAIRGGDLNGTRAILRIDDTGADQGLSYGARTAVLRGFEGLSDIDTGVNPFPSIAQASNDETVLMKSASADATARPWEVIGDESGFYLSVAANSTDPAGHDTLWSSIWYGDLDGPRLPGDASACVIAAETGEYYIGSGVYMALGKHATPGVGGKLYLPRAVDQVSSLNSASIPSATPTWNTKDYADYGPAYPHFADGNLWAEGPMRVYDTGEGMYNGYLRGTLPGLYNPMHINPLGSGEERTVFGRTLRAYTSWYGQILIDRSGPWRE